MCKTKWVVRSSLKYWFAHQDGIMPMLCLREQVL